MTFGGSSFDFAQDPMELFGDKAAILNSVVSDSYYGMLRKQIST